MKELEFVCKKCGHHLFIDEQDGWVEAMDGDCPECGEEGNELWILAGYGNYKKFIKQHGQKPN